MHTFNLSAWEAETGGLFCGQPGLQTGFQGSQGCVEKPCLGDKKHSCTAAMPVQQHPPTPRDAALFVFVSSSKPSTREASHRCQHPSHAFFLQDWGTELSSTNKGVAAELLYSLEETAMAEGQLGDECVSEAKNLSGLPSSSQCRGSLCRN